MEELYRERIFYIFITLNVIYMNFGHVTSATTNSGSVLEESQIQTIAPSTISLTAIPLYDTSATSKPFQIKETSDLALPESHIPQVSGDALPQSSEQSTILPSHTINEIFPLNTSLNNQALQSVSLEFNTVMFSSESIAFPAVGSGELSVFLDTQSYISSDIALKSLVLDLVSSNVVPTSSVIDLMSSHMVPTSSVIDLMSSHMVPTLSVKDLMSSNIVPTSSVMDLISSSMASKSTSSVIDLMTYSILAPTSSVIDMISSNVVPVQLSTSDVEATQSNAVSVQSDLASTQSEIQSTSSDANMTPSASWISVSDFVSNNVAPSESVTVSNESSLFHSISDVSVIDKSSYVTASTDIYSTFLSDFKSAFSSSDFETIGSSSDLSHLDSSELLHTSNSYLLSSISTELPESFLYSSQTNMLESDMTIFPESVSSEILFSVSSDQSADTITSLVSHSLPLSSSILESTAPIVVPESTVVMISPSSTLILSSVSSSTQVNETLPVPEKNTSGLTKGGKVALGICIPIIIILVVAAIVFYAYRRRYHSATWKLTDVVSYRPWSYSNATYYDDESTLIFPSLDK